MNLELILAFLLFHGEDSPDIWGREIEDLGIFEREICGNLGLELISQGNYFSLSRSHIILPEIVCHTSLLSFGSAKGEPRFDGQPGCAEPHIVAPLEFRLIFLICMMM